MIVEDARQRFTVTVKIMNEMYLASRKGVSLRLDWLPSSVTSKSILQPVHCYLSSLFEGVGEGENLQVRAAAILTTAIMTEFSKVTPFDSIN